MSELDSNATSATPPWQSLAQKKRSSRDALLLSFPSYLIPPTSLPPESRSNVIGLARKSGVLTAKELEITEEKDVSMVLKRIREGEWKARAVTEAYCKRAAMAQQLTNCLTEILFTSALERASELDAYLSTTGKTIGPLHGLPVSLKDQFDIEGVECTMGFASWVGRISQKDCSLVQMLKQGGAVLYCRTNVPQTLMWGETANHVFGRSSNPHNRNLTSGGSSGGEGALLGFGGSPAGFGTDIGGSIRIPSSFNGLYGLRPTTRRLPYRGASNTWLGCESIESSIGPMARSLDGLITLFKATVEIKPWTFDPKVVEVPWKGLKVPDKKDICFGVWEWDEVVMPHPPVLRAIRMTVDALEKAGYKIIRLRPFADHKKSASLVNRLWSIDGGEDFQNTLAPFGEPLYEGVLTSPDQPGLSVYQLHQLNQEKDVFRNIYHDGWQATKELTGTGKPIDAILCPSGAHAAPPHNSFSYYEYWKIWNLVDYPSVVFPVTTVDPGLDPVNKNYEPISKLDQKNHNLYAPETFKDAPVAIQLVGRRWREEELLGLLTIVDGTLKESSRGSHAHL